MKSIRVENQACYKHPILHVVGNSFTASAPAMSRYQQLVANQKSNSVDRRVAEHLDGT